MRGCYIVNVNKTEVLAQVSAAQTSVTPTLSISGSNLNKAHQFTYLGSILREDCDLTNELNHCIKLSAAAFGQLSQRVFFNHNLTVATKSLFTMPSVFLSSSMDVRYGHSIAAM